VRAGRTAFQRSRSGGQECDGGRNGSAGERVGEGPPLIALIHKAFMQLRGERFDMQSPDVENNLRHRIPHRGIRDRAEIPQTPREEDVDVTGDQAQFLIDHRLTLVRPQRREQEQILESETMLGVKEDTLKPATGFCEASIRRRYWRL
jgi:hypothetical protein